MRKLNIEITKAQITGFSVQLEEKKPEVTVSIALMTAGGKEITNYAVSTNSWSSDKQFDLPVGAIQPIWSLCLI